MFKAVGVMLSCVVFFHEVLSGNAHSRWEYVYQSLFYLAAALAALDTKKRVYFYGFLVVWVLFLAGGFFHLPRSFYALPGAVSVVMVGYGAWEGWQRRVRRGRHWAI